MEPTISILGGDLRQVYLARLLLEDGRDVTAWGLEQGGAPRSVSLDRALEGDILLLPLPVCRGDRLNLPLTDTELELRRLWPRLRYDQLLLGGMTGNLGPRLMADYGLTLLDYYAREETQIANAVPTAEGAIPGDASLLQTLVQNLLDNARKASEAGKGVSLTGEALASGGYRLTVADQGRGIPPDEIGKITEAFYMVDKSRSRAQGGAGLGLALCKAIAALHAQWLAFVGDYTPEMRAGLARLYTADERFAAYYDREVQGCAAFLRDAIAAYTGGK